MTTTTPPGELVGKPALPGCRLAVPGRCHLEITPAASVDRWFATDTYGRRHHDGDVVFGETSWHGALRLHYDTATQWRDLAAVFNAVADWIEATL